MITMGVSSGSVCWRTASKSASLISKEEQSSTTASARCSVISSLTPTVYPAANTSYPASRSANDKSSAISGVSSISSIRREATLLLADVSGAGQPFLLAFARLQIHNPDSSARRVVSAVVILHHRAPRLQRAHRERHSLEVVTRVVQHLIRVPVVREDCIATVHAHHRVAVERRFRPHIARRPTLFSLTDDIAFLRLRSGRCRRRNCCFSVHMVCATVSASAAADIFTRFFASAA